MRHLDARVGYDRRSIIHRDGRGIDFEVAAAVVEFHDHGDGVADVAVARHAQVEGAHRAAGGLHCLAVDPPLDGDENRIAIRVAHLTDLHVERASIRTLVWRQGLLSWTRLKTRYSVRGPTSSSRSGGSNFLGTMAFTKSWFL